MTEMQPAGHPPKSNGPTVLIAAILLIATTAWALNYSRLPDAFLVENYSVLSYILIALAGGGAMAGFGLSRFGGGLSSTISSMANRMRGK